MVPTFINLICSEKSICHLCKICRLFLTLNILQIKFNKLTRITGQSFSIPILMTTQTQSKLGPCVQSIVSCLPERTESYDKTQFSMLAPEVVTILEKEERKEIVIVGIETHICVLQTAMGELTHLTVELEY